MIIKEKIAESGHWYRQDGSPAYTITGKNGKDRPTTLRDARQLSLVPSVTTILGVAAKPALDLWKQQQVLLSALTLPKADGESEMDWINRILLDSKETGKNAAKRGTKIHACIQSYFEQTPAIFGDRNRENITIHIDGISVSIGCFCFTSTIESCS